MDEFFSSRYGSNPSRIVGAVAGMSKVEAHNNGWRAERMAVVALYCQPKQPKFGRRYRQNLKLSRNYGVPLFINRVLLDEYAVTQGEFLPVSIRPNSRY